MRSNESKTSCSKKKTSKTNPCEPIQTIHNIHIISISYIHDFIFFPIKSEWKSSKSLATPQSSSSRVSCTGKHVVFLLPWFSCPSTGKRYRDHIIHYSRYTSNSWKLILVFCFRSPFIWSYTMWKCEIYDPCCLYGDTIVVKYIYIYLYIWAKLV